MENNNHFIVGTRGSKLAVGQTQIVLNELKLKNPNATFELKLIQTSGDLGLLQQLGAFTREVEQALLLGEVDFAIHSLKDLPTTHPEGLIIASIPKREKVNDVLITKDGLLLNQLPKDPKIGTSSERRALQIKNLRPDAQVFPLNGNIFTRMNKVKSGDYDAIILALAGLNRVEEQSRASQIFGIEDLIPAVAQGALALQCRESDQRTISLLNSIDDYKSRFEVEVERYFLFAIGGGCRLPMAAYACFIEKKDEIEFCYFYNNSLGIQSKGLVKLSVPIWKSEIKKIVDIILKKEKSTPYFPDFSKLMIFNTKSKLESRLVNELKNNNLGISIQSVNEVEFLPFQFPNQLDKEDVIIITSKNAAFCFKEYFESNTSLIFPKNVIVVGQNTANQLIKFQQYLKVHIAKEQNFYGCLSVLKDLKLQGKVYWLNDKVSDNYRKEVVDYKIVEIPVYQTNSHEGNSMIFKKEGYLKNHYLFTSKRVFLDTLNYFKILPDFFSNSIIFVMSENLKNFIIEKGVKNSEFITPDIKGILNFHETILKKIND